jgi:hypothetical protein
MQEMPKAGASGVDPGSAAFGGGGYGGKCKPTTRAAKEGQNMSGISSKSAAFGKPMKAGSKRAQHPKGSA